MAGSVFRDNVKKTIILNVSFVIKNYLEIFASKTND